MPDFLSNSPFLSDALDRIYFIRHSDKMRFFLLIPSFILLSSCEIPQFNIPTHEKSGSDEGESFKPTPAKIKKETARATPDPIGQNPEKSYTENIQEVITGKAKHRFLPENPFNE